MQKTAFIGSEYQGVKWRENQVLMLLLKSNYVLLYMDIYIGIRLISATVQYFLIFSAPNVLTS
jgi:hypothetical protein